MIAIVAVEVPTLQQQVAGRGAGSAGSKVDRSGRRRRRCKRSRLRLLYGRQRLLKQAGDALEAIGGGVDRLQALPDLIEQRTQAVRAVGQVLLAR